MVTASDTGAIFVDTISTSAVPWFQADVDEQKSLFSTEREQEVARATLSVLKQFQRLARSNDLKKPENIQKIGSSAEFVGNLTNLWPTAVRSRERFDRVGRIAQIGTMSGCTLI